MRLQPQSYKSLRNDFNISKVVQIRPCHPFSFSFDAQSSNISRWYAIFLEYGWNWGSLTICWPFVCFSNSNTTVFSSCSQILRWYNSIWSNFLGHGFARAWRYQATVQVVQKPLGTSRKKEKKPVGRARSGARGSNYSSLPHHYLDDRIPRVIIKFEDNLPSHFRYVLLSNRFPSFRNHYLRKYRVWRRPLI